MLPDVWAFPARTFAVAQITKDLILFGVVGPWCPNYSAKHFVEGVVT